MKAVKIRRIAVSAGIILAAYLLQCSVFPALEIAGTRPNLMLIITASFGFMRGSREGMLVGFVNGLFEQMYFDEDIKLPLFMIAVSDLIYGLVIYFFSFLLKSDFGFFTYLNRIIVPETIYTIVITLGVYPLLLFINHKLEAVEKRSASKFV